jgi:hypothetical protein
MLRYNWIRLRNFNTFEGNTPPFAILLVEHVFAIDKVSGKWGFFLRILIHRFMVLRYSFFQFATGLLNIDRSARVYDEKRGDLK